MQKAIEIESSGMTLRGMSHIPEGVEKCSAVILFHGFTGNRLEPHRMFLKISRMLESMDIASFRLDFAGSGESDGNFEDMTLSGEVADAHAIFDYVQEDPRIDMDNIILLGLSMGGLVASLVAGDRPDEVEKLILLAPAGDWMKRIVAEQQVSPDQEVFDNAGNLVGRAFADDLKTLDTYPRAAAYKGPVSLIHGTKDETVLPTVSQEYLDMAYEQRGEMNWIEGADHTFNSHDWEQQVIRHICEFVKK